MRLTVLPFILCWLPVWAQHSHSPYAGMQERDVKALSSEQIEDLLEGRGMGATLPAELNGVPGPLHVLQLKERLQVTVEQQAALEAITGTMKASAQELGAKVIDAERELDHAFRQGSPDEKVVRQLTDRIGALNAELRAVHLIAHLRTRQILTQRQIVAYNDVRGYAPVPAGGSTHGH